MAEVGTSKPWGGGSGSHNKPIGCGASGVYAPGPDEEEEEQYLLAFPFPSVCLHVSERIPLEGFLLNLVLETCVKVC